MREPFTRLYVHLVWATWDRLPILSPDLITIVDRAVRHECVQLGAEVIAFGAVADHVHLLVRMPAKLSVAELVKQVKGATSHLVNQRLKIPFKWQGGYGAFSVSHAVLPRVRAYVLNQEDHHRYGTTVPTAELEPGRPAQRLGSIEPHRVP
jgi:REP element-mobilizing transposase RayT